MFIPITLLLSLNYLPYLRFIGCTRKNICICMALRLKGTVMKII